MPTTHSNHHSNTDNQGKPTATSTSTSTSTSTVRKEYKQSVKGASRPQSPANTHTHHHSNSTMSTASTSSTSSAGSARSEMTYYLVPNLQALDSSACEMDVTTHAWVQPTIIEDDDLTFGGKSLSAWYEEDRRRLSHSDEEEASRGRERVRRSHHSRSGRK